MAKVDRPKHYIRAWRRKKGLTLEQLAERLHTTHATLSRIERGKLPYNQPLLERLEEELGVDVASLLMRDPDAPAPIWSIWDQVPAPSRPQALAVLETFTKKTGTKG